VKDLGVKASLVLEHCSEETEEIVDYEIENEVRRWSVLFITSPKVLALTVSCVKFYLDIGMD